MPVTEEMSLTKFLGTSGVCSRRAVEGYIAEGRVKVNGELAERAAMHVMPGDTVEVDGKPVNSSERKYYIMLNKPRGYICTSSDIHAEKKAVDLIPLSRNVRLVSAGRLDKDSEGMILFSNDGDFIARLTHPRYEVEKTYHVSLAGELSTRAMEMLTSCGIRDKDDILSAHIIRELGNGHYEFVLGEGKNREIRRMAEYFHLDVKRLSRIAVGQVRLGGLACGESRELTAQEIQLLFKPARRNDYANVSRPSSTTDPDPSGFHRRRSSEPRHRHDSQFSERSRSPLYRGKRERTEDSVRFDRRRQDTRSASQRTRGRGPRRDRGSI